MADHVSEEVRSRIMSKIRAKDTDPEMAVRRFLHGEGFRYSLHRHDLPGRPDLVLPKYNTTVQVYGCFWHQHPDPDCPDSRIPDSNQGYWKPKLEGNRARDVKNKAALEHQGWNVEVVWACEITLERLVELAESIQSSEAGSRP